MTWHPRGEPTFPDWKKARPGTRVEHVHTGARGTLKRSVHGKTPGSRFAVIEWDARPPMNRIVIGRVIAPAFDLRKVQD